MDKTFLNDENKEPFQEIGTLLVKMLHDFMDASQEKKHFYDNADVKALLKISDKTLYRMRKSGRIPFFKFEKKIYYPQSFFSNLNF